MKARQIEKLYIKSSNEITRNKLFKEYIAEKIVQKLVIIIDEYKNGIRLLNDEEWIHIIANESIDIEFEIIQCNKYTNTVNAVNAVLNTMLTTLVTSDARQLRIQTSTLKESRKSLPKSLTGFRLIFKNHGLSLNETESVIKKMEEFNLNSIDATNNLSLESIAPQISYLATMLHINLEKTILDSNAQILFFENLIQSESRLVSLNISETVISPNQKASRIFSEYISKTRTLKILNISGNSYSTVCTHDILTGIVKNRSINSLDISRIDLISNIELLSNFRSKNFVYLNISHTNLGPRQTQQFLSNLGPTNHLKIMGLNCSIESIKSIMCRLYENLVRFEMPCVEFMIDDEGCCEIISTCCLMQALRFIDLSYHGCGRATAFALSRVFEVGMNLHVKLNGCVGIGEQEVDIIEGNGKGSLVLELFSSSVGIEKRDKVNNLNLGLVIMC